MERLVTVDHSEVVRGVQEAMVGQLRRDGRLGPGMELGLAFYATAADDLHVVGRVRRGSQVLFELQGRKPQLSAIVAGLALAKLRPDEQRTLEPAADVHFRLVHFTADDETVDRFMADVSFRSRRSS